MAKTSPGKNGQRGAYGLKAEKFIGDNGVPDDLDVARPKHDGKQIVQRRHTEWREHEIAWRRFLDAYEGGDRYRNAVYGPDRRGLPARNLFRHRREYPDPGQFPVAYSGFAGFMGAANASLQGSMAGMFPGMLGADPAATAMDDDYELRRARTPVPEFVSEAVDIHLGKVYDQEVSRSGPDELIEWWKDVDDRGTPINDYMKDKIAPLLVVLGNLDICVDHPSVPDGIEIVSKKDEIQWGTGKCCVSVILPQNMVWWRLEPSGRYAECLVREYVDPSDRVDFDSEGNPIDVESDSVAGEEWRRDYVQYRHWTKTEWTLYSYDGEKLLDSSQHPFGIVPIVRLVPFPKQRSSHIGKSIYEPISEYQREYYNRDSELILSDTLQAHPILSGPDEYCKADQTVSIGPGYVLPKYRTSHDTFEGWEYISPSKDPAKSLRENKRDLIDLKDRHACLTKPAGTAGAASTTVAQSGISKQLDAINGNKLLGGIAKALAKCERWLAEYVLLCLRNRPPTPQERNEIVVNYPARFELFGAIELADMQARFQLNLVGMRESGCPVTQGIALKEHVRQWLVGLTADTYRIIDAEIDAEVQFIMDVRAQMDGAKPASVTDESEALTGRGTTMARASEDPTGQSAVTSVAPISPQVY